MPREIVLNNKNIYLLYLDILIDFGGFCFYLNLF